MADVKVVTNAAGDVAIGVEVEGAFVPFATRSRAKVEQMVQRWHDLEARAAEGDGRALDVLGDGVKQKARARAKAGAAEDEE